MARLTCERCLFWQKDESIGGAAGPGGGQCRRYAPRPVRGGPYLVSWPLTHKADWCAQGQTTGVVRG